MDKRPAHQTRRKPPFFRPARLRSRRDGWSEERQCLFLAELYLTGSVTEAARRVGMSRVSAYRLRARDDAASFAWAWDGVVTRPGTGRLPPCEIRDWRKVSLAELIERFEIGFVQPVIYRGRITAIRRKPDISAGLRLLRRADANRAKEQS